MHVGNGHRPDFETLLGQRQLLDVGAVERRRRSQGVLRRQHVEIGLRGAQGQILPGELILGLGKGNLHFALFVLNPVLPAEQGLRELNLPAVAVVAPIHVVVLQIGIVPVGVSGKTERRHQPCTPLGQFLPPGFEGRPRSRQTGIV